MFFEGSFAWYPFASLDDQGSVHVTFSPAQDVAISGDRGQLQQVFTNLLVNAIHSMPQGGNVTVTVNVPPAATASLMMTSLTSILGIGPVRSTT